MTTLSGERFFYSPLHRRVAWSVKPAPWGGFLAEEMVRCTSTPQPSPAKSSSDTKRHSMSECLQSKLPVRKLARASYPCGEVPSEDHQQSDLGNPEEGKKHATMLAGLRQNGGGAGARPKQPCAFLSRVGHRAPWLPIHQAAD